MRLQDRLDMNPKRSLECRLAGDTPKTVKQFGIMKKPKQKVSVDVKKIKEYVKNMKSLVHDIEKLKVPSDKAAGLPEYMDTILVDIRRAYERLMHVLKELK